MNRDKKSERRHDHKNIRLTQQEFLQTLDLYLAELGEDPCYEQARQFYVGGSSSRLLQLDRWGNPAAQLLADARAGQGDFLAETAEAIRRAAILVWHPGMKAPKSHYRPDRFNEVAAQVIEALDPPLKEKVVITLEDGVRQGLNEKQEQLVEEWWHTYQAELRNYRTECLRTGVKGYKELSLFTFVGFAGGLGLGALLDALGFSGSAIGEWAVRTLSGEGEDLGEGAWVLRSKLRRKKAKAQEEPHEEDEEESMEEEGLTWSEGEAAEAYGTGKIVGMAFPWAVDGISRWAGIDVRAPEGSYVAYFYSLADQLFASINGLRFHIRRSGSFWKGVKGYFHDPVMVSSFTVVTLPFLVLYLFRSAGWRPDSLVLAAIEGILLNLCWVPPLTAWAWDWHLQGDLRRITEAFIARAGSL